MFVAELLCIDKPARRLDRDVFQQALHNSALSAGHDVKRGTAQPRLGAQEPHGCAGWGQPLCQVRGVDLHPEHALEIGIERACDEELLLACASHGKIFGEPIPRTLATGLLDETARFLGDFRRGKCHAHIELGAPVSSRKERRSAEQGRPAPMTAVVVRHSLLRDGFKMLRRVLVVSAVRSVHRAVPAPTAAKFATVRCDRETARTPPLRQFLRRGPGIPYGVQRRVVDAGDDNFAGTMLYPREARVFWGTRRQGRLGAELVVFSRSASLPWEA